MTAILHLKGLIGNHISHSFVFGFKTKLLFRQLSFFANETSFSFLFAGTGKSGKHNNDKKSKCYFFHNSNLMQK